MKTLSVNRKPGIAGLIIVTIIIFAGLLLSPGCSEKGASDALKLGIGVEDITPPVGYPHYQGISTGVKDPLFAKAMVFSQGDKKGALLICNIIGIPRNLSKLVRERASKETGIPFEYISVTATHTHTGPSYNTALQEYLDREAAGKLTEADKNDYLSFLIHGMINSIVKANQNLQAVTLKSGIGEATGISFNRRLLLTNGRVQMNPGRMNPEVVRPAGPIDPAVHYVMFKPSNADKFNASLTVFASHYARGTYEFSADYPSYLEKRLKEIYGDQLVSVFGSGTCGNINTVDVFRKNDAAEGMEWVEVVGRKIADAIKSSLPATEQKNPEFDAESRTLYLPLQDYSAEELEWAKRGPNDTTQIYPDRKWVVRFRRGKILSLESLRRREAIAPPVSGEPWRLPVEIQVFKLDARTAIVTLPGEIFVEHGLSIKARSPFENTMVIELANVTIGYVPDIKAFTEGDYEAINSRLAPGSGEKMADVAVEMLNELKNGR
jgi:neutral ceramidase